eukprot:gene12015-14046_t
MEAKPGCEDIYFKIDFSRPEWKDITISQEAKDFIIGILGGDLKTLQDYAKYHVNKEYTIGKGASSQVYTGKSKSFFCRSKKVAVKKVVKYKDNEQEFEMLKEEIAILRSVKHKHIIKLREVFLEKNHMHLILDLLYQRAPFQKNESFAEINLNFKSTDANSSVSDLAKDFILNLLVIDPHDRMSASDALNHPWLNTPIPKKEAFTYSC